MMYQQYSLLRRRSSLEHIFTLKTVVLVIGATREQGASVAHQIKNHPKFALRVLTRYPNNKKIAEFAAHGAEIVVGSYDDQSALEKALKGVHTVFLDLNYWEHAREPHIEIERGKSIADLAKKEGVKHFIYSSLEDTAEMTNGRLVVNHFVGKAQVARYAREIGLNITEIRLGFEMENLLSIHKPILEHDASYSFIFPMGDKPLDLFSVEDTGGVVRTILENPKKWIGKTVGLAGDSLTGHQISEIFTRITGKKSRYKPLDIDEYKKLDMPYADDYGRMFEFYQEFAGKLRDVKLTRELYPQTSSFTSWLEKHKNEFG